MLFLFSGTTHSRWKEGSQDPYPRPETRVGASSAPLAPGGIRRLLPVETEASPDEATRRETLAAKRPPQGMVSAEPKGRMNKMCAPYGGWDEYQVLDVTDILRDVSDDELRAAARSRQHQAALQQGRSMPSFDGIDFGGLFEVPNSLRQDYQPGTRLVVKLGYWSSCGGYQPHGVMQREARLIVLPRAS